MLKNAQGCVTLERMNREPAPEGIDTNGDGRLTLAEMKAFDKKLGAGGDFARVYVMAHEYGHHVQNLVGTSDKVTRAQRSNPSAANPLSVRLELQADCYAGVWVGDANRRNLLDSPNEIQEAIKAAEGVGDDRIQEKTQGRIDPESWTHGSAEQRRTWFLKGFNTIDPTTCDTFRDVL